jgi:hypothetical protein
MKLILILLSFLILGACSSVSDVDYPDFVNLKPEYTIVWGNIEKGEYLPEHESECAKDRICINLDPPPLKLTIEIEEIIYGHIQSKIVTAYTTSHYGLATYFDDVPYLFLLKSNGKDLIIPRYSPKEIAFDIDDKPTLSMLSVNDTPNWLPCEVSKLNRKIEYDGSDENVLHAIESFTLEDLKNIKDFSIVSEYSVRVIRGIYLSDLKSYLADKVTLNNCAN